MLLIDLQSFNDSDPSLISTIQDENTYQTLISKTSKTITLEHQTFLSFDQFLSLSIALSIVFQYEYSRTILNSKWAPLYIVKKSFHEHDYQVCIH